MPTTKETASQISGLISQKRADCLRLYLKYGGRRHRLIEEEMRGLGWWRFSRRVFYRRGDKPGWPERFGWKRELRNAEFGLRNEEKEAGINRSEPPTPLLPEEGWRRFADGVVGVAGGFLEEELTTKQHKKTRKKKAIKNPQSKIGRGR